MAVGIICTLDLLTAPYVFFYADICRNQGVEYCIFSKGSCPIKKQDYVIETFILNDQLKKKNVVARNLLWYKWLKRQCKERNVDRLIVLPTITGIGLIPYLFFNRAPFIFDIRDFTHEDNRLYLFKEKLLINKASMTIISSDGFKQWLPKTNKPIYVIHNMPYDYKAYTITTKSVFHSYKTIGYVGLVNYYETNKILVDKLASTTRYQLRYSGAISSNCPIKKYVEDNGIEGVSFTGPYSNEDKLSLYQDIDMINAIYGRISEEYDSNSMVVTTALPNKLYDAILLKIPILVSKGTFLAKVVDEAGVGLSIDAFNDDIVSMIDHYWETFNRDDFELNCEKLIQKVVLQQEKTVQHICGFII